MLTIRDSILISIPARRLWEWLCELPEHYGDWHPAHDSCTVERGFLWEPGAVVEMVEDLHGKAHRLRLQAIEVNPGREIVYRGAFWLHGRFLVEPVGNRARFTAELSFGLPFAGIGGLTDWILAPLFRKRIAAVQDHQREEGANLKALLEQEVGTIGQAFVEGLRRILGEKLYGVYIYGAAAFPDAFPTGDIDFHVILKSELTDSERSELEELHKFLAEQFRPLGGEMDGYYILLDDARHETPPRSQMWHRATDDSWALHREHIRAGRHVVLHGPDPTEIYPPASWPEQESALYGELDYVEKHLHQHPDYCILNLCRLIYSFETGDVAVSKANASDWARGALPEWRRHIELAKKSYARQATPEDRQFMLAEVGRFLEFAHGRIQRAGQTDRGNREAEG